ncbi:MAG: L-aspartate oxidase [Deltaproteobacteria bacterium]|nr:L-aspartate oxidase [Deltaproteobacteria bacterium]
MSGLPSSDRGIPAPASSARCGVRSSPSVIRRLLTPRCLLPLEAPDARAGTRGSSGPCDLCPRASASGPFSSPALHPRSGGDGVGTPRGSSRSAGGLPSPAENPRSLSRGPLRSPRPSCPFPLPGKGSLSAGRFHRGRGRLSRKRPLYDKLPPLSTCARQERETLGFHETAVRLRQTRRALTASFFLYYVAAPLCTAPKKRERLVETFDFLVLGSGIAGLSFALEVSRAGTVAVVTKKERSESNSNYAQGGIAAVLDPADSFDAHIADTLDAGAGLCHQDVVEHAVREGPRQIERLIRWGVGFSPSSTGNVPFDLGREGGHSHRRIVHAKDTTGREVEQALLRRAKESPNIRFFEDHCAVDLLVRATGAGEPLCFGAYVLGPSGRVEAFTARFTCLATGGAGKVYLYTSNPDIASGDGVAMAFRSGAAVANLEFMQFHPTCLFHPFAKNFLISEAVRGEGGILRLRSGEPFMERYDPRGCLAPRDIVARAIDAEMKRRGDEYVLLDITQRTADFVRRRFPGIYESCLKFGIDITSEPIPVVPAAHYLCGGVVTDLAGRTTIRGLYAVGEVACTGLHGANRLASNSLLEALVFSEGAARDALREEPASRAALPAPDPWDDSGTTDSDDEVVVTQNWDEIRRFMWNYVGIVRTNKRLERARHRMDLLFEEITDYYRHFRVTEPLLELRNLALVADLMIRCAMSRRESRGLHFNLDYPSRNDVHWSKDTVLRRSA